MKPVVGLEAPRCEDVSLMLRRWGVGFVGGTHPRRAGDYCHGPSIPPPGRGEGDGEQLSDQQGESHWNIQHDMFSFVIDSTLSQEPRRSSGL